MKSLSPHLLVRLLLILEQRLKTGELGCHVGVDLKVALDDLLHLAYVIVHVLVYYRGRLHTRDDLALLSQQLCCFFKVLEVVLLELLVLVENVVHLLVESQQIVVHHLHALPSVERLL
jgi:hypothetical protein